MPKIVKYILFALLGLFAIVFIVPFMIGLLSTINPKKSVELGKQKAAEYANIYVPTGYTLTKKADWKQSDEGDLFVTTMNNQKNNIQIIQSGKVTIDCKGTKQTMGNKSVCLLDFGNKKVLMWESGSSLFQLETDDTTILDSELSKIVSSL